MKRFMLILTLTIIPLSGHAQAPDAGPPHRVEQELSQIIDNPSQEAIALNERIESLLVRSKELHAQVKAAKQSKSATEIALALSSLLFLILAALRKTLGREKLSGNKVRLACLITGAVASLLGYYGGGYGAVESLQLFMAGLGSMAINESIKIAKPTKKG